MALTDEYSTQTPEQLIEAAEARIEEILQSKLRAISTSIRQKVEQFSYASTKAAVQKLYDELANKVLANESDVARKLRSLTQTGRSDIPSGSWSATAHPTESELEKAILQAALKALRSQLDKGTFLTEAAKAIQEIQDNKHERAQQLQSAQAMFLKGWEQELAIAVEDTDQLFYATDEVKRLQVLIHVMQAPNARQVLNTLIQLGPEVANRIFNDECSYIAVDGTKYATKSLNARPGSLLAILAGNVTSNPFAVTLAIEHGRYQLTYLPARERWVSFEEVARRAEKSPEAFEFLNRLGKVTIPSTTYRNRSEFLHSEFVSHMIATPCLGASFDTLAETLHQHPEIADVILNNPLIAQDQNLTNTLLVGMDKNVSGYYKKENHQRALARAIENSDSFILTLILCNSFFCDSSRKKVDILVSDLPGIFDAFAGIIEESPELQQKIASARTAIAEGKKPEALSYDKTREVMYTANQHSKSVNFQGVTGSLRGRQGLAAA